LQFGLIAEQRSPRVLASTISNCSAISLSLGQRVIWRVE
jgi:hypothetical protein